MLGLTGSPDESGHKDAGERAGAFGNARVRRGMIQLALAIFSCSKKTVPWRSGLEPATENARGTRKTMIVALARKASDRLCGRLVQDGVVPDGIVLRPAQ